MAKISDKSPPHDEELERAALGSMLFDADAVDAAVQYHLQAGDFYSRAHQRIFEAVLNLDGRGLRSDIQTVIQELKQNGKLDEAGGAAYVSSLTTVIPSSANIEFYLQSVLDHSLRRALLRVASGIGVAAYDESRGSPEILEEVEQDIFELRDNRQAFSYNKIDEVLTRTIDKIDEAYRTKKTLTGIPTGYDRLNEMTSGFQPSDFVIIGARPSIGKTALALNMAAHIAFKHHIPAAFFSLEMSDVALAQRLISSEARVDGKNLRSGYLTSDDFRNIISVSGRMNDAPFYIVDMPNMKLLDLRSQARKLRAQEKVEIIFVDYLGLIGHENNSLPRHEQISEISRSLKSLARELKIPVVVLCQLNREMERTGQGQPPTLANLRDSGSIEQDADLVLFLHKRPPKVKKDGEEDAQNTHEGYPTELIIAKQRNGPVGVIELVLQSKYALFTPLEKPR
ncbi:MAG: replicative DNA helicase [Treponema sp.]|jgi:replicative DNA helicase|nr:replicative DNA helicase [Treponema sp.]